MTGVAVGEHRIADPCHFVYASGKECGLLAGDHRRSLNHGPQHAWSATPVQTPRCVQCGVALVGWAHSWPTGTASCQDCYYADWGIA